MTSSSVMLPDLDALDSNALKSLLIEKHAQVLEKSAELESKQSELESHQNEIERLKLFIAKLQRMQFGPSSERVAHHIDQLVLQLEELETTRTATAAATVQTAAPASQPARKPLPANLPR